MRIRTLLFIGLCSLFSIFPSFAETKEISNVKVSVAPTEEIQPGKMAQGQIPHIEKDSNYVVSFYKTSTTVQNPMQHYLYTIKLSTVNGYTFSLSPTVTVEGAYKGEILQNTKNDILISASVYPFTRLPNPNNINNRYKLSEYTWDHVPYATGYEVTVFYGTYDKDNKYSEKSETIKTNEARINILPYMVYSDKISISVKAVFDNDVDAAGYIIDSETIYTDKNKKKKENTKVTYQSISLSLNKKNLIGSNGGYAVTPIENKEEDKKKPSGGMPETGIETKWVGAGDHWQYTINGNVVMNRWFMTEDESWYYAYDDGRIASGLQDIDGKWYYFSTQHDGTFGILQSGYLTINGVSRYFHPLHDGNFGAMYQNQITPNGKVADMSGVLR